MTLTTTHTHGDRITVRAGDVPLLSYVYRPDPIAVESAKPYVHPLRTLAGNLVSGYRPNDHRWHKGLQLTCSYVSGQNFWGGRTFLRDRGPTWDPERVGAMRHDGFAALETGQDRCHLAEDLTWVTHAGAEWASERRGVTVHAVDPAAGAWALDWSIRLTNIRDEPLVFGSPTTNGRELAGYTGLQWRGPRDFVGGTVFGPDPAQGAERGGELMGTSSPWLAFTAPHDDVDAHSTLVFAHAPENLDPARAIHDSHWFVRSTPIPTVAFSWAFFEEFRLPPGGSFAYRYRVVVADGAWDRARVADHLAGLPW
ncbi:PmoA family protein [Streptomyces sp. DSM 44915]|uniref:PmoA family protein n=1 Tax=Streptomyces chisholmiae TaxID=3075540 RepID=A0ABU2JL38_9ACTN|nr:PmoA family protein [Streptomyces sp. DSM 44915]MDT0265698.1 PmoA family protein [Streptomyces sp. DSM 44915]